MTTSTSANTLPDRVTEDDRSPVMAVPRPSDAGPEVNAGLVRRAMRPAAIAVVFLTGAFVLWELAKVATGSNDRTMPHGWTIVGYLFSETSQGERYGSFLLRSIWVTGKGAILGLAVGAFAGVCFGVVTAKSRITGSTLLPLLVAAQTVPIVAIAPAIVLWLGTGGISKVVITAYLTFFPVAVATARGIQGSPASSLELLRTYGASPWQVLRHVQIPTALPLFFVGLETAAALSVVGAIVAELPFGSREGLGVAILTSWQFYTIEPAALYNAALGSCFLGVVLVSCIRALKALALRTHPRGGVL